MAKHSTREILFTVAAIAAFILGSMMVCQVILTAVRVTQMAAWPSVPATLDSVEMHRPGSATSRTLSVAARYHYVIDGKSYAGTRVSVYPPDSIGPFFQRTYDGLNGYLQRHDPVPVHVNPAVPAESVIFPVWRPELIAFQMTIALLGFGAGIWALSKRAGSRSPSTGGAATAVAGESEGRAQRLPASVANGRRLVLVGLLFAAGGYLLLEHSRNDPYTMLDRALAAKVNATGTVFVNAVDHRVPTLVDDVARALGVNARVSAESRALQSTTYTVRIEADGRMEALDALARTLSKVQARYREESGGDLTTFVDPYVAPVVTPRARFAATIILMTVGLLAFSCIGGGLSMSRRHSR